VTSKKHRMERNSVILVSTEMLVKLMGMITTIVVARLLGADQFGFISFAYALAGVTLMFSHYGFDKFAVRELARRPQRASLFLVHVSLFRSALFLPAAVICMVAAYLESADPYRMLDILLVFITEAALQHTLFICGFFRAIHKMGREGLVRFCIAFLSFSTGVPILLLGFGVTGLIFSRMVMMLLCLYLAFFLLRKDFILHWTGIHLRYLKKMLRIAFPLALIVFGVVMYMSTGPILLGLLVSDEQVGYYQAALTIITPFAVIADAVGGTSLPLLSLHWNSNSKAFAHVIKKSIRYLLLIVVPLAMGIFIASERGIMLLFGQEYFTSAGVLMVMGLVLIPDFINIFFSILLIAVKREKWALRATYTGIGMNVLGGLLLIPHFGAIGAALAWMVAEITVFFIQVSAVHGSFDGRAQLLSLLRIALACALMGGVLLLCNLWNINLFLTVFSGIVIYGIGLVIVREISNQELQRGLEVFQSLIHRKSKITG